MLSILETVANVETKFMFGGVSFMINVKISIGIMQNNLMCSIGADKFEKAIEIPECRTMDFSKRSLKGYDYEKKAVSFRL